MDQFIRVKRDKVTGKLKRRVKASKIAVKIQEFNLFFASGNLCNFVGIIMGGWIQLLIYLSGVV